MSYFKAEMHQIRFRPAGGAYDALPDPLVGWGAGYRSTILHPYECTYGYVGLDNYNSN